MDVNQAAKAQLEVERVDATAIEALLQAEPDVLGLQLLVHAERAGALHGRENHPV